MVKIIDQREEHLRLGVDMRRALDHETVGLRGRKQEYCHEKDDDDRDCNNHNPPTVPHAWIVRQAAAPSQNGRRPPRGPDGGAPC
jgi:hypothetical protein